MEVSDDIKFLKPYLLMGPGISVSIGASNYIIYNGVSQGVNIRDLHIESNARIVIWAHGNHFESHHYIVLDPSIDLLESRTSTHFELFSQASGRNSINIELFSCHGGYAKHDLKYLPIGSTLMTFVDGEFQMERFTLRTLTEKSSEFSQDNAFIRFSSFLLSNPEENSFGINTINGPKTKSFTLDLLKDFSTQGIKQWQIERIKDFSDFLEEIKSDLDEYNQDKVSQFIKLVKNEDQFEQFIAGVNINEYKRTLIENLIYKDQITSLKTYLDNGNDLDVDFRSIDMAEIMGGRDHPLFALFSKGEVSILKALFKAGVNPNQKNGYGNTLLCEAVYHKQTEMVKFLLDNGANPNEGGYAGVPLAYACQTGNLKTAELLLAHGANPNLADKVARTCLQMASSNKDMADLLLSYKADLNQKGIFKRAPIHEAIFNNNTEMTEYFISQGADLKQYAGAKWQTALYFAKKVENQEIIDLLIEAQGKNAWEAHIMGWGNIFDVHDVCYIL